MSPRNLTPPRLQWVGPLATRSAFSQLNRTMTDLLKGSGRWQITHHEGSGTDSKAPPAELSIWHDWEQDFLAAPRPESGKFVAIRPWDFGPYPPSWVDKILRECDELWVHSTWIHELALRSGIPPEQVRLLPLGIDCDLFQPEGPRYPLPPNCRDFRFLFAGATVRRKGFDIALNAFLQTFEPGEEVSLVVKDRSDEVFYRNAQEAKVEERIKPYLDQGNIVLMHGDLPIEDLAALYRSCQVLTLPYRAEGFALTAVEAMACGTPCIVPEFGACLDYCDHTNALFVKPRRVSLPVGREIVYNTLGFTAKVTEVDFCEVPVDRMAQRMREAFEMDRGELEQRGAGAARTIRERFSLAELAAHLEEAIDGLLGDSSN